MLGGKDGMNQHHEKCIDHTTCDGMIAARDDCIHRQANEIYNLQNRLREDYSRLSDIVRRIGVAADPRWVREELERLLKDRQ